MIGWWYPISSTCCDCHYSRTHLQGMQCCQVAQFRYSARQLVVVQAPVRTNRKEINARRFSSVSQHQFLTSFSSFFYLILISFSSFSQGWLASKTSVTHEYISTFSSFTRPFLVCFSSVSRPLLTSLFLMSVTFIHH